MKAIRVAMVGIGNCASALVQGVSHYRRSAKSNGLIREEVAGYRAGDLEFVLGIDVDERKVGRDLAEAIFAKPNNTARIVDELAPTGCKVIRGAVLDGVAEHMSGIGEHGFLVSPERDATREEIVAALRRARADVLVNFLPVGSQRASEFYIECALEARVGVVNCIPVFIASDPEWEARFRAHGLPIVGDDIKSQLGATIVHRMLADLFSSRGIEVERTYQLNTGGNTDFLNMLDRERLGSKKLSKTEAVQAALHARLADQNIMIGPSDYVPWQKDNKVCFLRIEAEQFGGVPMNLELRLSVEDSPNAAACALDAIRYCKGALDRGEGGALLVPSAYYCKHPPVQMNEKEAERALDSYFIGQREAAE